MGNCRIFSNHPKSFSGYTIDELIKMFGWRISNAVYVDDVTGKKGLIAEVMYNKCKMWKFWNHDIRAAYRCYIGYLQVPWTIRVEPPSEVFFRPTEECKKIKDKYTNNVINPA